jgi:hypothetical protein
MIPSGASSFSIGRASGWKRPCAKLPVSGLMILPSSNASFFSSDLYLLSIELIEAAENDLPRSFMIPRAASSAEISLSDLWPPFGPPAAQLTDQGREPRTYFLRRRERREDPHPTPAMKSYFQRVWPPMIIGVIFTRSRLDRLLGAIVY